MRCEELRGLLDLYLDGELPEETARRLDRHLLRCPACAYEARTLEQTQAMLREAIPPAETSPAFRERASARLLDALAPHLRPAQEAESARQWTLPFLHEEKGP
jgi:anti-sigma factor RsiW